MTDVTAEQFNGDDQSPPEGCNQANGCIRKPWRLDLLKVIPGLRWLLSQRWFQFALVFPTLVVFYLFFIAGIFGSPIGSSNIIVIFVWILWWFVLIVLLVPFGSRVWCTICPFPFFGEWYQRRALIGVRVGKPGVGRNRMWGLNKRWPKFLSNIWLQNIGFLLMCTFNVMLVTRPIVSLIALGGLVVIATILHFIYRQRAFCSYVCPVSGFLSLYSMASMVEVRVVDKNVCKTECKTKSCLVGNEEGWGCPWLLFPSNLERNNYCGLCMECIKSCRYENMTVNARPFCSDTLIKGYDEAWKAFIMLALALLYSVSLLGPWGTIKDWANVMEVGNWKGFFTYAGILWFFALVGIPAIWALFSWLGKLMSGSNEVSVKELFLKTAYLLVPLGLMAWAAFSFPLIMVNGSYIARVATDPMGWGWDLLRIGEVQWKPFLPEYAGYIQIVLLTIGLFFALKRGREIVENLYTDKMAGLRSLIPVAFLCLVFTAIFLRLFIG